MTNCWWEIQILCHPALEESFFWRLEQFGCSGTAREFKGEFSLIRAYIPQIQVEPSDLEELSLWLRLDALNFSLPEPKIHQHLIEEEDWASSWQQYWQPRAIGDRFLIYPAWLTPPETSERLILRLDPGPAFGTGTHPTTQLCLEALEMHLAEGSRKVAIADIGCGSGILSIGAILLGANRAYAVDTDPLAVRAACYNRQLNKIESSQLIVEQGGGKELAQLIGDGVDGIICNILADVIIELIPQFTQLAKPQTWGILSGILIEQANSIAGPLAKYGWEVTTAWKLEGWCCLNVRRTE